MIEDRELFSMVFVLTIADRFSIAGRLLPCRMVSAGAVRTGGGGGDARSGSCGVAPSRAVRR